MKHLNTLIANKIRTLRSNRGISQQVFSDCIGMSRSSIVNLEKGRQSLTIDNLYKICDVLECEVKDILPAVNKVITPFELPKDLVEEIDKISGSKSAKIKKLIKTILK